VEKLTPEFFSAQVDLASYGAGDWELVSVIQGPSTYRFPDVVVSTQDLRVQVTLVAPSETGTP
jgi:hypothetical protein